MRKAPGAPAPPPASGRSGAGPLLGPGTVSRRLLGHPLLLLGGPRALLMQVAHPAVAAGVVQHSGYAEDPFGRLARTLGAMEAIAFGSPARAERTRRLIDARHRRVSGLTPGGRAYSARDPELLLWVHATLIDSAMGVDARYIGLLGPGERARFYDESRAIAAVFGIPGALVPPDLAAFEAYLDSAQGELEVGADALAIAESVMHPSLSARLGVFGTPLELVVAPWLEAVTADLLSPALRRAYGLRPGGGLVPGAIGLEMAAALSRVFAPRLPPALRSPGSLGWLGAVLGGREARS